MNLQVNHNGNNITSEVVEYTRSQRICNGVGTAMFTLKPTYATTINPYHEFVIYEDGIKKGTYFVSSVAKRLPENIIVVETQDITKRLSDYFISDVQEITTITTSRYWLEKYLTEAGIQYQFMAEGNGHNMSLNTWVGNTLLSDFIQSICAENGWYFLSDPDGKLLIGKMDVDFSRTNITIHDTEAISIDYTKDDKMLRNRVIVRGNADPLFKIWVKGEVKVITPWNYDERDYRSTMLMVPDVPDVMTANSIANSLLQETQKITQVKTVDAVGFYNVFPGSSVYIDSEYFQGYGLVTSVGSRATVSGCVTTIIVDERCPRLFGYYKGIGDVYVGTRGQGVWKKPLKFEHNWSNFSEGLTDLNVKDLHIVNGVYVCSTDSGKMFKRTPLASGWVRVNQHYFFDEDSKQYVGPAECKATTVNKTTGEIYGAFTVDPVTVSGAMGYYDTFKSFLVKDDGNKISYTQIKKEDNTEVYIRGMDHDGADLWLSSMVMISGWRYPNDSGQQDNGLYDSYTVATPSPLSQNKLPVKETGLTTSADFQYNNLIVTNISTIKSNVVVDCRITNIKNADDIYLGRRIMMAGSYGNNFKVIEGFNYLDGYGNMYYSNYDHDTYINTVSDLYRMFTDGSMLYIAGANQANGTIRYYTIELLDRDQWGPSLDTTDEFLVDITGSADTVKLLDSSVTEGIAHFLYELRDETAHGNQQPFTSDTTYKIVSVNLKEKTYSVQTSSVIVEDYVWSQPYGTYVSSTYDMYLETPTRAKLESFNGKAGFLMVLKGLSTDYVEYRTLHSDGGENVVVLRDNGTAWHSGWADYMINHGGANGTTSKQYVQFGETEKWNNDYSNQITYRYDFIYDINLDDVTVLYHHSETQSGYDDITNADLPDFNKHTSYMFRWKHYVRGYNIKGTDPYIVEKVVLDNSSQTYWNRTTTQLKFRNWSTLETVKTVNLPNSYANNPSDYEYYNILIYNTDDNSNLYYMINTRVRQGMSNVCYVVGYDLNSNERRFEKPIEQTSFGYGNEEVRFYQNIIEYLEPVHRMYEYFPNFYSGDPPEYEHYPISMFLKYHQGVFSEGPGLIYPSTVEASKDYPVVNYAGMYSDALSTLEIFHQPENLITTVGGSGWVSDLKTFDYLTESGFSRCAALCMQPVSGYSGSNLLYIMDFSGNLTDSFLFGSSEFGTPLWYTYSISGWITFSGMPTHVETSNYGDSPYIFVTTEGSNNSQHFFQRDTYDLGGHKEFFECPSGFPQSEITCIRIDDRV